MIRLVDISRLVENLHLRTPTGIDRVEMAYVQHMLQRADRADVRFVVTWPHFTGILPRSRARPLIDAVMSRWSASGRSADDDQAFVALREILGRSPGASGGGQVLRIGEPENRSGVADMARMASIWIQSAAHRLSIRKLAALRKQGVCYFHTSQFRLDRSARFRWLSDGSVRAVFVLHDLIPIVYPEYCRPGEAERHKRRVATMLQHASVIIANSAFTRASLERHVERQGIAMPRCEVVPLGVSAPFVSPANLPPVVAETPYFVAVGTIEPRKNLAFLLQAWQRWTQSGQSPRARLVIVGRRGWENENVIDLLERSPGLASTVIEVATLSDAGMMALLRDARALLAPSLVEGFGLPVAEALALGVPAIASDIDAHREVGGALAEYVSPLDGPGWVAALEDYASPDSVRRQRRVAALQANRPATWSDHMTRLETIVAGLTPSSRDS